MTASPASAGTRRRPPGSPLLLGAAVLLAAIVVLALGGGRGPLTAPRAIVLGAVEGVTEYLPVSSTGHLLVTERLLGLGEGAGKTAADTYAVAIQLGAILAVIALYWHRIVELALGLVGRSQPGRVLLTRLVVAFLPAAALGAGLNDAIKDRLFGPWPVVAAWAAGGVFLLVWRPGDGALRMEDLTIRSAFLIGCAQALALWPGVSRSLVTIAAAVALGCRLASALEFSFLLGLATLAAATVLDLAKDGETLVQDYGLRMPVLGALVAFATALVSIRWLVAYLRTRPLAHFGWYRLAAAAVTVGLLALGWV